MAHFAFWNCPSGINDNWVGGAMEVGGQRLHAPSPPNSIKEISCRALGLALSPLLLHIHLSDMAFYWSL